MGQSANPATERSVADVTVLAVPVQKRPVLRTSRDVRELARNLAYNVVSGYVEHDHGHLDRSAENFCQVYSTLFPEAGLLRARRASELYVDCLVKQDEIEDAPGHGPEEILNDPRWADVRASLVEFSRMLDLPEVYADTTMNFYRYHGVRDPRYVQYCLESDGILTRKITQSDYWARMLGSLYLACTDCHDKHDSVGLESGIQFASKYFEIILRARPERKENTPTDRA